MERLVMARWVMNGYRCWQPPRAKWSTQDIFDLFDFVAVKADRPVNFVQVKRERASELERARIAITAFSEAYPCPVSLWLVSWRKPKKNAPSAIFEAYELQPYGRWTLRAVWYDEVV